MATGEPVVLIVLGEGNAVSATKAAEHRERVKQQAKSCRSLNYGEGPPCHFIDVLAAESETKLVA